nr:translation initiation factor IF-2-like [Gorilla gorilla gorilla]
MPRRGKIFKKLQAERVGEAARGRLTYLRRRELRAGGPGITAPPRRTRLGTPFGAVYSQLSRDWATGPGRPTAGSLSSADPACPVCPALPGLACALWTPWAAGPRREDGRRSRDICGRGPVAGWKRRGVARELPGGENAPGEHLVCSARRSRIPEKEPGRESGRAGPGSRKTAWRRLPAPAGLLSCTRGELASRADPSCRGPRPGTGGSDTPPPAGHLPWVPLNPGGSSLRWRSVRSGTRETPNPACPTS